MDQDHQVEDENNFKNEKDEAENGADRTKRRKPRHEKNDKKADCGSTVKGESRKATILRQLGNERNETNSRYYTAGIW
jgi:hypothetical protein